MSSRFYLADVAAGWLGETPAPAASVRIAHEAPDHSIKGAFMVARPAAR